MEKKLTHWERMEAVIRWANMTTNYFARYIGLPRGENLYQIKRGNNGISLDVANRVVEKFPGIDKLWLLTGEGSMLVDSSRLPTTPFYKADAERDITRLAELVPDGQLLLPMVGPCDCALCYNGQAMGRELPAGSVVALERIAPEAIIPGAEYVVVSKKIVTLRIVRAAEEADAWRLVAGDRERYDDIVLKKKEIEQLYKVKVKLIIND